MERSGVSRSARHIGREDLAHRGRAQTPGPADQPVVRLLILSTPKTGSTWLRHLLSCMYGVPQLDLDYPFNLETARLMGSAWVSHHHFHPTPELLDWIRGEDIRVITMTRHPGDVLISLYHHLRGFKATAVSRRFLRRMLH